MLSFIVHIAFDLWLNQEVELETPVSAAIHRAISLGHVSHRALTKIDEKSNEVAIGIARTSIILQ